MMRNFKILVSILCLLIVVYFMNTNSQNQLLSKSDQAIIIDKHQIKKILIQQDGDALELVKNDTLWTISGNDTLIIKSRSIDDFFNKVLEIKKETIISENPEKYATYSIDDSTGTHLALIDSLDKTIGYYIFGKSKSDYSRSYIRIKEDPNVYLADQNVIYMLSTRPTYWGETAQQENNQIPQSPSLKSNN